MANRRCAAADAHPLSRVALVAPLAARGHAPRRGALRGFSEGTTDQGAYRFAESWGFLYRWNQEGEQIVFLWTCSSLWAATFSHSVRHRVVTTTLVILISIVKTALLLMLAGALLGAAVASFLVPPMLSWYTSPGGLPQGAQIPAVVQIPEVIRYATSRLLLGQAIGGGIGAMAGLMVGFSLRRKPSTANTANLPTPR